jgi:hypothetical protein
MQAPIPKTRSPPTDLDAPSFLTKLAPETRTQIYELLFVQEQPLEISPDHPIGPPEDRRSNASYPRFYSPTTADTILQNKNGEIRAQIVASSTLLLTCRQIYHEVIGILYGQNHFSFYQRIRIPYSFEIWVAYLGQQLHSIRNLTVGIESIESQPWIRDTTHVARDMKLVSIED